MSGGQGNVNLAPVMENPAVQQAMQDQMKAAMNDPANQAAAKQKAMEAGQAGLAYAQAGAAQGVSELNKYIQEGPAGVSVLCFLGGLATMVVGLMGLINILGVITEPFHYLLNGYLTVFGVVAVLLEADIDRLDTLPMLKKLKPHVAQYQKQVFEEARFLTELRGRGLFYLFIGTLAITQCLFCLFFLCGAWNIGMGVICIMMSFGHKPPEFHVQAQQNSQMASSLLAGNSR